MPSYRVTVTYTAYVTEANNETEAKDATLMKLKYDCGDNTLIISRHWHLEAINPESSN